MVSLSATQKANNFSTILMVDKSKAEPGSKRLWSRNVRVHWKNELMSVLLGNLLYKSKAIAGTLTLSER